MRPLARWLSLSCLVASVGCESVYDMDADEPCRQAGFAIAARTEACTNDGDLANRRYEALRDKYSCTITKATEADFLCSRALLESTCDDVAKQRDDYDAWFARHPRCGQIFARSDGSAPAGQAGAGGAAGAGGSSGGASGAAGAATSPPSMNAVCHGIAVAFNAWVVACGENDDPDFDKLDQLYTCTASWTPADGPPPAEMLACQARIPPAPCPPGGLRFTTWLAQNPDCAAFFKELAK